MEFDQHPAGTTAGQTAGAAPRSRGPAPSRTAVASLVLAWAALAFVALFAATAGAAPVRPSLRLELLPAEGPLLQDGVLVGELVLVNTGSDTLRLGPHLAVAVPGGLAFEIMTPGGSTAVVDGGAPATPAPWHPAVAIPPKGRVVRPICLLKLRGRYLFAEAGSYRVRARFDTEGIAATPSSWVVVEVRPAGAGRDAYRASHGSATICDPFIVRENLEAVRQRLHRYLDYRHEQVKFLLYQYQGGEIRRIVHGAEQATGSVEVGAEIMLAMARAARVGESMWTWITNRLEQATAPGRPPRIEVVNRGYVL
ncbi:MAG: hypothetical protein R6X25_11135 [Candidatus Krumholzibacteriia bacterium]